MTRTTLWSISVTVLQCFPSWCDRANA